MPGWTVPDGSPRFGGRGWFHGVRLPGLPGTARFRRLVAINRSEAGLSEAGFDRDSSADLGDP